VPIARVMSISAPSHHPGPADWPREREQVLERIAVLDRAAIAALRRRLDEPLREAARAEAHELAGALRRFGFGAAAKDAYRLGELLAGDANARALSEHVVRLRADLERRDAAAPAVSEAEDDVGAPVLIFVRDAALAERLGAEAGRRGLRAEPVSTADGARAAAARERPLVVLLDRGATGALDLVSELAAAVPVLVLAAHDSLPDRVEVVRRGARAFLPTASLHPRDAIEHALQLAEPAPATGATLLAVATEPGALAAIRAALEPERMRVATLSEPLRFWDELERVGPDMVLLATDMPEVGGIELCRVVRADRRWSTLPVLCFGGSGDPETMRRAFAAGADDCMAVLDATELAGRVRSRLERARLHRQLVERDALTGVANRQSSIRGIERLLALSTRYGEPVTLTTVDLERLREINDRHGHAAGDAVLRRVGDLLVQSFRGEDVVGRWGGEEFVVGMYGMARHDAVRRMRELLARFEDERFAAPDGTSFGCSFSAGIAVFGEDADDLHTLHRAADRALAAAKAGEHPRVRSAGDDDHHAGAVDGPEVVVVESDPVLVEVLLHELATRGHRARAVLDGAEAAEALAADGATLRPRVLLLDIDLPGVDGVAVLRRLRAAGVLKRMNVIMLTGRSSEQTVLQTLRLGAFDHLAKPVSVPVLMSKVARAMEARPSFRMAS
jgi:diguanylate cyclase (GGDEF)-like protein